MSRRSEILLASSLWLCMTKITQVGSRRQLSLFEPWNSPLHIRNLPNAPARGKATQRSWPKSKRECGCRNSKYSGQEENRQEPEPVRRRRTEEREGDQRHTRLAEPCLKKGLKFATATTKTCPKMCTSLGTPAFLHGPPKSFLSPAAWPLLVRGYCCQCSTSRLWLLGNKHT